MLYMANFKEIFQSKHVILPVIHVESADMALRNAMIAREAGADGVFLINMRVEKIDYEKLLEIQKTVKTQFHDWWIGINCLDLPATFVFNYMNSNVDGVWTDNGEINAQEIKEAKEKNAWQGLYFGGVAFKYQNSSEDPVVAAKKAVRFMDVVTTSGNGTGFAPDMEKIKKMKEAIGDFPLAIASGISTENVCNFLPFADCFIVASSLLKPGTNDFDAEKVRELVDKIRTRP